MQKLIPKIFLFLVLIWSFDLVIGESIKRMYFSIESGTSGALMNHLLDHEYDVYIMGASAAQHGYIPEIIEKGLGLSVYNAGEDATSIFYKYAILQLILEHHKPKMIIWDVLDLDYFYYQEYTKSNFLKPYYHNPRIYNLLKELDPINIALKISHIYPYNHKLAAIITELVSHPTGDQNTSKGYLPVYGEFDLSRKDVYDKYATDYLKTIKKREQKVTEDDRLVRKYFEMFIEQCNANGIKIVAFTSPRCPVNKDLASIPLISEELVNELAKKGIAVHHILPATYPELNRTDIYKDLGHLNHEGAQIFSNIIAYTLVDQLEVEKEFGVPSKPFGKASK